MNESLLDGVEVDEVEDDDYIDNRLIKLRFSIEANDYGKHFSETITNIINKFECVQEITHFSNLQTSSTNTTAVIDFKIDADTSFEQFCDLISRMVKPRSDMSITYEIDAVCPEIDNGQYSIDEDCCLKIRYYCYDKSITVPVKYYFYKFFKFYYPDMKDENIAKTFFHYYAFEHKIPISIINFDNTAYYIDEQYNLTNYRYVEGFRIIKNNFKKYTFIDKSGDYLITDVNERWFEHCGIFNEGYARVEKNNGWTFIDTSGNYLIQNEKERWFVYCENFHEGFAVVKKGYEKYTYINASGEYLIQNENERWFDECNDFHDGFAKVQNRKKNCAFIDTNGNFLVCDDNEIWFYWCHDFHEGFAVVTKNNTKSPDYEKYTFIDTNGDYLITDVNERWFSVCENFSEGFAAVKNSDGKWTFVDTNGNYLINDVNKRWFGECEKFSEGFARVTNDSQQYNFIDASGNLVFKDWYDDKYKYTQSGNGLLVTDEGNHINTTGEFVALI